jgi:hypothetical protein
VRVPAEEGCEAGAGRDGLGRAGGCAGMGGGVGWDGRRRGLASWPRVVVAMHRCRSLKVIKRQLENDDPGCDDVLAGRLAPDSVDGHRSVAFADAVVSPPAPSPRGIDHGGAAENIPRQRPEVRIPSPPKNPHQRPP